MIFYPPPAVLTTAPREPFLWRQRKGVALADMERGHPTGGQKAYPTGGSEATHRGDARKAQRKGSSY